MPPLAAAAAAASLGSVLTRASENSSTALRLAVSASDSALWLFKASASPGIPSPAYNLRSTSSPRWRWITCHFAHGAPFSTIQFLDTLKHDSVDQKIAQHHVGQEILLLTTTPSTFSTFLAFTHRYC